MFHSNFSLVSYEAMTIFPCLGFFPDSQCLKNVIYTTNDKPGKKLRLTISEVGSGNRCF